MHYTAVLYTGRGTYQIESIENQLQNKTKFRCSTCNHRQQDRLEKEKGYIVLYWTCVHLIRFTCPFERTNKPTKVKSNYRSQIALNENQYQQRAISQNSLTHTHTRSHDSPYMLRVRCS